MAKFEVDGRSADLVLFETLTLGELGRIKENHGISGQVLFEHAVHAFDPDAWTAYLDLSFRRAHPDIDLPDGAFDDLQLVPLQRAFEQEALDRATAAEAAKVRPTGAGRSRKTRGASGAQS